MAMAAAGTAGPSAITSKGWYKWLFGKSLSTQEVVKQNQRIITKTVTKINRERLDLENQERVQILEIKTAAKKYQLEADLVRTLANELVRIRNQIKKLSKMRQNLQSLSVKLKSLDTPQGIAQAIYHSAVSLRDVNNKLNMPKIRKIVEDFEKLSHFKELKEEIADETEDVGVCGTGVTEDDTEESEEIISAVLDELGLQFRDSALSRASTAGGPAALRKRSAVTPTVAKGKNKEAKAKKIAPTETDPSSFSIGNTSTISALADEPIEPPPENDAKSAEAAEE